MIGALTAAQINCLKCAASRPGGSLCPTVGVHAAAQGALIAALDRKGFVEWNGPIPRISAEGLAMLWRLENHGERGVHAVRTRRLTAPQKRLLVLAAAASHGAAPLFMPGQRRTARALERLGLIRCHWGLNRGTADYGYITVAGRAAIARATGGQS